MNSSLIFSIAGLFLSIVAVAISTVFLFRQTTFQRHANQIPISVNLAREYRSIEFQEAQDYVLSSLATDCDPSLGFSKLPDDSRTPAYKVASYFTSLGSLVVHGMADERFVVSILGFPADRSWSVLEPYIVSEREIRNDVDFLAFYEDLVFRVRKNRPLAVAYGFKLNRVTDGGQPSDPPSSRA